MNCSDFLCCLGSTKSLAPMVSLQPQSMMNGVFELFQVGAPESSPTHDTTSSERKVRKKAAQKLIQDQFQTFFLKELKVLQKEINYGHEGHIFENNYLTILNIDNFIQMVHSDWLVCFGAMKRRIKDAYRITSGKIEKTGKIITMGKTGYPLMGDGILAMKALLHPEIEIKRDEYANFNIFWSKVFVYTYRDLIETVINYKASNIQNPDDRVLQSMTLLRDQMEFFKDASSFTESKMCGREVQSNIFIWKNSTQEKNEQITKTNALTKAAINTD